MAEAASQPARRALWVILVLVTALSVGAALWAALPAREWATATWALLTDRRAIQEAARRLVESAGILGPLVFILIQAAQVVISPIPGEATGILGGVLFGTWVGFFYSSIGLTIGSVTAFWLGHLLGAPLVQRIGGARWHRALDFVGHTGGELVSFILFLMPGFPKDYLSYLLGFSPMPLRAFVLISTIGRMPGTWLLSATGAGLVNQSRTAFSILLILMGTIVVIAFLFRDKLLQALRHASGHRPPHGTGSE